MSSQQSTQADHSTPLSGQDSVFGQSQQYANHGIDSVSDSRISKSKLLDIYRMQQASDEAAGDVSRLFVNNWDPGHSNGTNGRGWGKSNDTRDQNHGPEVCWDQSGQIRPIGLEEMSELEKAVSSNA
jgi:PERQ amino acid-rich with GYF domain-containing protein